MCNKSVTGSIINLCNKGLISPNGTLIEWNSTPGKQCRWLKYSRWQRNGASLRSYIINQHRRIIDHVIRSRTTYYNNVLKRFSTLASSVAVLPGEISPLISLPYIACFGLNKQQI